jgi:uncharacterized protein YbaA (DUF1428 family)
MAKTKNQTRYVDGFVLVVPKNKVATYRKMATEGRDMWMKFGALDYKECMGDDLNPNMEGMLALTFPKMIKAKKNETVWFSYITFKSRAHRDQVNKKVMAEMPQRRFRRPTPTTHSPEETSLRIQRRRMQPQPISLSQVLPHQPTSLLQTHSPLVHSLASSKQLQEWYQLRW